MQERKQERGDFRRLELRFIKSFKYKHKLRGAGSGRGSICDERGRAGEAASLPGRVISAGGGLERRLTLVVVLLLASLHFIPAEAFCPSKCVCNDQSLSANCTQVSSISIVPMTLNPLLKHMTLNHLPIIELSNSLSVYRQLETLNLRSNFLKQITYQNFNFKSAPHHSSITIPSSLPVTFNALASHSQHHNDPSEFNLHNQQLARHLKGSLERLSSAASGSAGAAGGQAEQSAASQAEVDSEEIRFHLRELDLSDNKIDTLGSLNEEDLATASEELESAAYQQPEGGATLRRLKAADLERQAPFLTLTRLELLNLSLNRIQRLHRHVFLGLVRLKRLNLSKNYLEYLDKQAFVGLVELERLDLSSNRLARQLSQLGLAFCRAPMVELRHLDLSEQQQRPPSGQLEPATPADEADSLNPRESILMLPNQMFLCASKLISLHLNGLQLRYIQVGAFENLLQLDSLNLSKNLLEQVPSDSFNHLYSNVSKSLRQLDLSENLIEFVNVRSFDRLENLQKLIMNRMPNLLSFDLASLSLSGSGAGSSSLLPNSSPNEPQEEGEELLINEQLMELQLKQNPRLQSVHSSLMDLPPEVRLASAGEEERKPAGRIIRFNNLRELQLEGNPELRELALDRMLDLRRARPFRLDLSYSNKLNCSSCQMGWLVEAARAAAGPLWPPVPALAAARHLHQPAGSGGSSNLLLSDPALIGCAGRYAMPLSQLLELDFNLALVQERCRRFRSRGEQSSLEVPTGQRELLLGGLGKRAQTGAGNQSEPSGLEGAPEGSLALQLLSLALLLGSLLILARFSVGLLANRPSSPVNDRDFQWRSPSRDISADSRYQNMGGGSGSGSGSNGSPADCSSSSILSAANQTENLLKPQASGNHHQLMLFNAATGTFESRLFLQASPVKHSGERRAQIELAEREGNLFSRIANQLSALLPRPAKAELLSSAGSEGRRLEEQQQRRRAMGPILENIAYEGCLGSEMSKRMAFANKEMLPADFPNNNNINFNCNEKLSAEGCVVNSANINSDCFVYANCPQQSSQRLRATTSDSPAAAYLAKTGAGQLTTLSPAALSASLLELDSASQQHPRASQPPLPLPASDLNHIYVTLDGPIKQEEWLAPAAARPPSCASSGQLARQDSLRAEPTKSTNRRDYKSFEWAAGGPEEPLASYGNNETRGDKFKLLPADQRGAFTSLISGPAHASQMEAKLSSSSSILLRSQEADSTARNNNQMQPAGIDYFATDRKGSRKFLEEDGNVTSEHSHTTTSDPRRLFVERNLNGSAGCFRDSASGLVGSSGEEAASGPSGGRCERQLPPPAAGRADNNFPQATNNQTQPGTQTTIEARLSAGKYDANHDVLSRREDNDYVFNELARSKLARAANSSSPAGNMHADVDISEEAAPSEPPVGGARRPRTSEPAGKPPRPATSNFRPADMIGQQAQQQAARRQPELEVFARVREPEEMKALRTFNLANADHLKAAQICDTHNLPPVRQSNPRKGSIKGNLNSTLGRNEFSQLRGNHNNQQIYTNQFYYCKPQSGATLSRASKFK